MRVLHIYRTYFPETHGGVQEAIRQIALATGAEGVDNRIFSLARAPQPARLDLPEAPLWRGKALFELASCDFGTPAAVRLCRQQAQQADLLHLHFPWPFADLMLPLVRRRGQPIVVTYHSDIVRQRTLNRLYAPLRERLLGAADAIVATSPNYLQSSTVLARHAGKTRCIPLALAAAPPVDAARLAAWRQRLGDDFFLFVGVLRYYKGLHFLIEAMPQVAAPLVIVGDGPLRGELEAQAQRLAGKGGGAISFLGPLPDADKLALLQLCRGVVFPSHLRSEAFGVTLLEGARAARPLISCEIGTGTSWVNQHDETGFVVPPADPAALAAALNRLHADPALGERLGAAAQARWQQEFSPPPVGQAYAALYRQLLAGR